MGHQYGRAAFPADAENAAVWIRQVAARYLPEAAMEALRINGSSVKVENIAGLWLPTVQGALVGGASLEAATFGGSYCSREAVNR